MSTAAASTMRVLVIGSSGQLGYELLRAALPTGMTVTGVDLDGIDITSAASVAAGLAANPCELVVNAAAYTAVDRAEGESAVAFAVNRDGPAHLAAACAERGIPLIHVSTDYVFDGTKLTPYLEDDPIVPVNLYGASKAAGETEVRRRLPQHVILRTSWVYCAHGTNFVKTMLRLGRERPELGVIDDQVGAPTAAADLAAAIIAIATRLLDGADGPWGTFHYTGGGETSWYGFAAGIFDFQERMTGHRPRLRAITTADYPTPARRPANSRLDCTRIGEAFGIRPVPWRESLERVLIELQQQDQNRQPAARGGAS